ncbi:NAD(P)-dependent dehydrogenase (short-subunit alcohol dehydrogenase family) [Actinoplanes tereljensis]|uniref:Short-chain dehydrogenase n=1 Tax=Paractinoplanes tereljensis TaxID=571912 RepID=A0A919NU15_9ACTN|nr:SDR family oxidoreductase [Actinoplanes tereljensis]GIF23762.1 short-chain dehydrogenase [Actinoplanes tereljensis]
MNVVVVGGSRGLGLGVTRAAQESGARVTVVARDLAGLDGEQGDARDEGFAAKVLAGVRPDLLVITAGAVPEMGPLTGLTWAEFSVNWHSDVRIAFTWLRAALRLPLAPGSRVVVFGSAASLRGSRLSGGYAGAKATVRLITEYAAEEASALGIAMTTVLPGITPGTTVGETAIRAYAKNAGRTEEQFRANLPDAPPPEAVGRSILGIAAGAYLLEAGGPRPLP